MIIMVLIIGMVFSVNISWAVELYVKEQGSDYIKLDFILKKEAVLIIGDYKETEIGEDAENMNYVKENIQLPNSDYKSQGFAVLGKVKKGKSSISLNKLEMNTDYVFNLMIDTNKIVVFTNTLSIEPYKASRGVRFVETEPGSIEFNWKAGKGINRKIIISDSPKINCKDGVDYKSGNGKYGIEESKITDNTFVLYDSKVDKNLMSIKLNELAYQKYYIFVYEYNGEGKYINYNKSKSSGNPKLKYPKLKPPIAKAVKRYEENIFSPEWETVKGAIYYEIQVSTNEDFSSLLEEYENADIGNTNVFDIWVEDMTIEYFYRLRAVSKADKSNYSNAIKVNFGQK